MRIDDASVFQETLSRLRQRYALHYHADQARHDVEVQLTAAAFRRYPQSEVRFRRVSLEGEAPGEVQVSRRAAPPPERSEARDTDSRPRLSRRPAVNDRDGHSGPGIAEDTASSGGWRRPDDAAPTAKAPAQPAAQDEPRQGGWRKLKPGEQP